MPTQITALGVSKSLNGRPVLDSVTCSLVDGADIDRRREAAARTARQVAPGRAMKDRHKMAYDRAGGRVRQSPAGRVRNAEERLRRLLANPVPPPPEPLRFVPVLPARPRRSVVLDVTDVAVNDRLDHTGLTVTAGERLLITGPNGAGRSTLLRVLAGEVIRDSGSVARRRRIGHLRQDPRPHETPPVRRPAARRTHQPSVSRPCRGSGSRPDRYDGALVIVSHDRRPRRRRQART